MSKTIEECERNMIGMDSFFGYVIQVGLVRNWTLSFDDDSAVAQDQRVMALLSIKVPLSMDAFGSDRTKYMIYTFNSTGPTVGHVLQGIYDQMQREVL